MITSTEDTAESFCNSRLSDPAAKVLESNPQIDDGIVRHRLKLLMLDAAS